MNNTKCSKFSVNNLRGLRPEIPICVIYILPDFYSLGPFLSYALGQAVRMKLNVLAWLNQDVGEVLATFGNARLVKRLTGKIELVGDYAEDRAAAKEWVALFLHEVAI